MTDIPINLNQTARVRLTTRGIEIYQSTMAALNERLPVNVEPFKINPPIDDDGYYRGELWRIMQEFGAAMSMALTPPFHMDIIIES